MNKNEAIKVIGILMQSDGSCEYCARALCICFYEDFPEFRDLVQEMFKETFNSDLFNGVEEV